MQNKFLLILGICFGLLFVLLGIILPEGKIEDKNIIVSINGHPLYQSDWDLALQALAMNKRNEIAEEERLIVLERLIDEQLLLQRGLEIDLPQTEGMVRKSIVNAMIDKIVIEGEISEATDKDLKSFYEDNKIFFAGHSEVHIKIIFLEYRSQEEDEKRLDDIRKLLIDGEDFDFVSSEYGDYMLPEIPNMLLPIKKLKDYIEPNLVPMILNMQPGQITSEIETTNGFIFIYMLSSIRDEEKPFEEVREQVKDEYLRRNDEISIQKYMEWLRGKSEVIYAK